MIMMRNSSDSLVKAGPPSMSPAATDMGEKKSPDCEVEVQESRLITLRGCVQSLSIQLVALLLHSL